MPLMVLGSHLILGTYGFWLPNDPRGSGCDFVGSWELLRQFGAATRTQERRSLAHDPHDISLRRDAKKLLKYPAVHFSGIQARAIARGFATLIKKLDLTVWACAILPDHIHLVVQRHRCGIRQIARLLKGAATRQLKSEGIHPLAAYQRTTGSIPKAFGRGEWAVFLDSESDILRAMDYVRQNPVKEGLPLQRWWFETAYPR